MAGSEMKVIADELKLRTVPTTLYEESRRDRLKNMAAARRIAMVSALTGGQADI
jgi:hypothetical protein